MKWQISIKELGEQMEQTIIILAGVFALPAWVAAQAFPAMPPAGYDQTGLYPAGAINTITYYSSVTGTNEISPSSPAFFSTGQGPGLFPNGGAQAKQMMKTLLLSCGTADWDGFYPPSQDLHDDCVSNDIPHGWLPVLGERHDAACGAPPCGTFSKCCSPMLVRYSIG